MPETCEPIQTTIYETLYVVREDSVNALSTKIDTAVTTLEDKVDEIKSVVAELKLENADLKRRIRAQGVPFAQLKVRS